MEHVNEFLKYSLEVLAILGIVIEVTPIKFSPIKWIANKFNEDIKKELKEVKKDIEQLQIKADERDIATLRNRISNFENLVRLDVNKDQLKKHQYVTAFKDIDRWNEYHVKYTSLNGELKLAIQNIEYSYKIAKFEE